MCAIRALAYHIIHRFTIKGEPFPNPADTNAWKGTVLFQARSPLEAISYDQLYAGVLGVFATLGIHITKKTHAFRVAGARAMDEAGVDDKVIARFGQWLYNAMHRSYLMFFKVEGLLAVAGFEGRPRRSSTPTGAPGSWRRSAPRRSPCA